MNVKTISGAFILTIEIAEMWYGPLNESLVGDYKKSYHCSGEIGIDRNVDK